MLAFAIVAVFYLTDGREDAVMGSFVMWACLFALGLLAPLISLQLIWPTSLVVSDAGIEQRGLWGQPLVPWADIAEFVALQQSISWSSVTHLGLRFAETATQERRGSWHKFFSLGQYDRWIMSASTKRSAEVLNFLTERHRAALSSAP